MLRLNDTRTWSGTLRTAAAGLLTAGLLMGCGDATDTASETAPAGDTAAAAGEPGEAAATEDVAELQQAYDAGLDYLASLADGNHWKMQDHPSSAYTALAVTPFLERPGGMRESDRELVEGAVKFVADSIGEDGGVVQAQSPNYMTSVAIMAMAASENAEYEDEIARAAEYIKRLQFLEEGSLDYGGIGYGSDNTRSDLSNTQYALASLRAAGISEDDPAIQRIQGFLKRTQNRKENETAGEPTEWTDPKSGDVYVRSNDGGANYRPFNSKAGADDLPDGRKRLRSYGSMTFALLRCYHMAGVGLDDAAVQDAVKWIGDNWTLDRNPGMPEDQAHQGLFYMYMSMGKALPLAGIDQLETPNGTIDWRSEVGAKLLSLQAEDGSWVNAKASRWNEGDELLATAYALTALGASIER